MPAADVRGISGLGPAVSAAQNVLDVNPVATSGDRAERAYDWLVSERLPDGSWPSGPATAGAVGLPRAAPAAENEEAGVAGGGDCPHRS